MKYKAWLDEWISYYVEPTTKARTCIKYRNQVNNHIVPKLGGYELEDLTANVLQSFTAELTAQGFSSNTVISIVSVVKSSLKRAVELGILSSQCTSAIVCPKHKEKRVVCFSKSEQRKLERYIISNNNDRLFGILLCLYTGLRVGELLALMWTDVDFGKGVITVSKSCHDEWKDGRYVKAVDTPKTESSYRVVPIPKQLIAHMKAVKKHGACEYVVSGNTDFGAEVRSYQRTFSNLLQKLDIAHKGIHALRHTFATRALEIGMDVKTLSEILGHSNPMITLKRYAHSMLEHKIDMMNKLGKLFEFGK